MLQAVVNVFRISDLRTRVMFTHDLGLAYRGERDEVLIRLNPVE